MEQQIEQQMEQVRELPNGKCVRKYSPEHPLFYVGTRLWVTKYYQEPESMKQPEEVVAGAGQVSPITCRLANCNVSFQSTVAYEEHYDMVHRNICRECLRSFVSLRLLDIHISETHDAFFRILSKKKPMYICLVDGCHETFRHDDKRSKHLIQVHQYPESFSFHQRRKQATSAGVEPKGSHVQQEVDAATLKKREARKRRRQQKKKKLYEQAELQVSEMQVDAGAASQDATACVTDQVPGSETTDVEMSEVEESMRELRIPMNVHFGRKRRL